MSPLQLLTFYVAASEVLFTVNIGREFWDFDNCPLNKGYPLNTVTADVTSPLTHPFKEALSRYFSDTSKSSKSLH